MARQDREESLEEQLAWLDAIKESEEAPVRVSAKTGPGVPSDETAVVSPYPQDPWAEVPQHDPPTPPLFRAAIDSVYGTEAGPEPAERRAPEPPADDSADTKPAIDDAFLAPLRPLPRPDDTDSYSLSSFRDPEPPDDQTVENLAWPTPPAWTSDDRAGTQGESTPDSPRPEDADDSRLSGGDSDGPRPTAGEGGSDGPRSTSGAAGADETRPAFEERSLSSERASDQSETPGSEPASPDRVAEEPRSPFSEGGLRSSLGELGLDESRPAFPEPPQRTFDQPSPPFVEPSQRDFAEARTFDEHLRFDESRTFGEPRTSDEPQVFGEARPFDESRVFGEARTSDEPRVFGQPRTSEEPRTSGEPRAAQEPVSEPRPPEAPRPRPAFTVAPRPPSSGRPSAESLDPDTLLRGRRNAPSKGWRRLVYKASGGWIKPGEPPEVKRRRALMERARTPVATGHHRVAVLSLKGGVGKTTTTVGLGATLAQIRGDRVIAVDANPDRGTLSDKLRLETSATVRDLLNERDQVKRYVDIRAFTSQAPSRLEVLASDRDPSVSEAFGGADYEAVSQVLENFYSICITDCGTGLLHSAMGGVLGLADQIVLVSSPSVDGARAASATLDWLEAHDYESLVREATVVLCSVRPRSKSAVDINKLEGHFAARCRAVIRVPYDPHLEEGAEIDLDRLQEATRDAYLQLAASVGDGFAGERRVWDSNPRGHR
ncbi:MAG TPA: AAA family ATPase [Nonomuraea sp.]|nr:AAA family ATPase [Nonomuraea sp.]